LAGLLLEVAGETQGPSLVVVGLGLNTRLGAAQGAAIDQPWIDLSAVGGGISCARNRLAAQLGEHLVRVMERYGKEGLAPFLGQWRRFDLHQGEPVEIRLGNQIYTGIHAGITPQGALRLEMDGRIQTFQAGEVSLRPIA
jgi:BirA family biotin operon repressor/biotin-[acetyl-CoA-carboxylase] ligase